MSARSTVHFLVKALVKRRPFTLTFSRYGNLARNVVAPTSCGCRRTYTTDASSKSDSTIDSKEIETFNKLAHTWWNEQGELASLHTFNKVRVPWIRDTLVQQFELPQRSLPLESLNILDVGCGGGILTEPLARLGGSVTGVDAEIEGITVAKLHKQQDKSLGDNLQYIQSTVEDLVNTQEGKFDALIASEVIEHVSHKETFVEACCKLVKPGGSIFMTTLNKTAVSYALAVFAAERLAGIVPPGTHDHDKFISPEDLENMLAKYGCVTQLIHGLWMSPVTYRWSWVERTDINFALHAVKR